VIDLVFQRAPESLAILEPAHGVRWSTAELTARVETAARALREAAGGRRLVFLAWGPDADGVALYLACLRADLPVVLAEPEREPLARLAHAYRPALVLAPESIVPPDGYLERPSPVSRYRLTVAPRVDDQALHPSLALLLTTSGSTGSPKLVRLTCDNLAANATAIAEYLGLGPDERAIQSLPMHYSYGLSVLNSHLVAGAAVVITPHSFMRPEFWRDVDEQRATSFAGVPYLYETLHRLRFEPAKHRCLKTYTQAGGGLRRDLIAHYHARVHASGGRFFVMYGQTEATARISYLPPERLDDKLGSIGIPIPRGRMHLEPIDDGAGPSELIYEGPNVMLGYAESVDDLALGDVQHGVLRTGDLGTVDADGFYTLVGRLKRFAKLFGRRISLEDIERELEAVFPARIMATDGGDRVLIHAVADAGVEDASIAQHAARFLNVPPVAIALRRVDALPLTATGKKNYKALEATT
jgi:acyl-CoA synthetase (AMP-forming)/AMP-acid ligase II